MASSAHAFFCFEVLAASFQNRSFPRLEEILDSYEKIQRELSDTNTIKSAYGTESSNTDIERDGQIQPQLRLISRLQASSSSSGSASSTPSTVSVTSLASQVATSPATDISTPPTYASRLSVTETYPMFVTWNTISRSGHKSLRGCIGTFEALPLEEGLEQYALTSAFEDTRFAPIPASILPNLSCSLTLLADFEDCENAMDWTLGLHGIRISFTHRYRRHGATYLPDVAVEQGWSKEETLESLMRKAGWEPGTRRFVRGSHKPWEEVKDFQVVRYTGLKASASYTEWQEWRSSVSEPQPKT